MTQVSGQAARTEFWWAVAARAKRRECSNADRAPAEMGGRRASVRRAEGGGDGVARSSLPPVP
eukprot:CAMPEP_0183318114 /NCGR_PEP_ID=MMETSP0160_2-20130417/59765_1 /TAXON_ID=2839 ORGANISM="Odontella Sinensis, Strain Grunow 1884" /NCGR_SAMPLE_ID=MMETSP0160_2 /ASSEMBLY_ACC=CAM_ASM_000250 /LENGTH=62 /DNA_ID=CAMNT_0025484289 /DNA_START=875 /DNA_END=1060 /DNA_ORIENTATION=+